MIHRTVASYSFNEPRSAGSLTISGDGCTVSIVCYEFFAGSPTPRGEKPRGPKQVAERPQDNREEAPTRSKQMSEYSHLNKKRDPLGQYGEHAGGNISPHGAGTVRQQTCQAFKARRTCPVVSGPPLLVRGLEMLIHDCQHSVGLPFDAGYQGVESAAFKPQIKRTEYSNTSHIEAGTVSWPTCPT